MFVRFRFLALLVVLLLKSPEAHAQGELTSADPTDHSCRYSIAYEAPDGCPAAGTLERRLGAGYRVQPGTMDSCEDCVRGIRIRRDAAGRNHQMRLAGLESTTVERVECAELVDLAVYAIEASDLPAPTCTGTTITVGLSTTPFVNISNLDPMALTELRGTLHLGKWSITPSLLVVLPNEAPALAYGNAARDIAFKGSGASLQACRAVHSHVDLCGVGMWRYTIGILTEGYWTAASAADVWTVGTGLAWEVPLTAAFHFELEPVFMAVLGKRGLTDVSSGVQLYNHSGFEALLRVGFSWGFGASETPVNSEALRAAAVAPSRTGAVPEFSPVQRL